MQEIAPRLIEHLQFPSAVSRQHSLMIRSFLMMVIVLKKVNYKNACLPISELFDEVLSKEDEWSSNALQTEEIIEFN